MCGRARLTVRFSELAKLMRFEQSDDIDLRPRLNISPTQTIPIVRIVDGRRRLDLARWGLIPRWVKDVKIGSKMFNARVESVATKPVFRGPLVKRRCLVVVDGFYEWKPEGERKVPHVIRTDGGAFTMAGLWESWTSPDGEVVESCTVITRDAVGVVATLHDRMPVVLEPDARDGWLDPGESDPERLVEFLVARARTAFDVEPIDEVPSDVRPKATQLKLFG